MKEAIKQYLEHLNERERRAVMIAALALLIFIPYQFAWVPFRDSLSDLDHRVERQQKDLLWMRERVAEAHELTRAASGGNQNAQPVYGVIESSARQRFGNGIRVSQEGKGGVRVTVKNISFDDLMLWLDNLYARQHVNVKDFVVERQPASGRVNANILIVG